MLAFLLAAVLACPVPGSTELVGLWESQETSKGAIGYTLEFRADGTFVGAVTVLVNAYYRVEGNRLVMSETPGGKEEGSQQFRIEANRFVQIGPNGSVLRKDRINRAPGTQSIVGDWRYRHYTGAMAFERYTDDGQMLFRLPLKSSAGCYSLNDRGLSWSPQGRKALTSYQVRGNTLALQNAAKPDTVFVRAPAGPWYEREHLDINPPR